MLLQPAGLNTGETTVDLQQMGRAAKQASRRLATLPTDIKNAALLAIAAEIEGLWLSDLVRIVRPTVVDEVRQGLEVVEDALFDVVPRIYREVEEAAASLGASRAQTLARVVLPALLPAWLTGFALAFARALGEYGSVVFIAGNMPMKTEISSLLIMTLGAEKGASVTVESDNAEAVEKIAGLIEQDLDS